MKQRHAVALQYQSAQELPVVLGHGFGTIAEQLLQLAQQHGIPIQENAELSSLLKTVAPGQPMSEHAQKLVAQIISFLYYCDEKFREKHQFLSTILPAATSVADTLVTTEQTANR